jgi:hypothetical protein
MLDENLCNPTLDENLCDMLDGSLRLFIRCDATIISFMGCVYVLRICAIYVGCICENGLCKWAVCAVAVG